MTTIKGYYLNNKILCLTTKFIILKNNKTNKTKVHDITVDRNGIYCFYEKGKKHELKNIIITDNITKARFN